MQIIGGILNKQYILMVPEIELDNFEFDSEEEFERLKHYFYLTQREWIDLLGLWRDFNDQFHLCLDMCEEDWLYAKDVDDALQLIEV